MITAAPLAIVLAAGKGTRMKSDLPKVLCQADGQPLVRYVIDALRRAGVGQIVAVVGYRAELVEAELADVAGIAFARQTEQLGTGHAVMMARRELEKHSGPVIVVAGDSPMLQTSSLEALLAEFYRGDVAGVLGTLVVDNPHGLGRIVRDQAGRFSAIVEEKDATPEQRLVREVNMSTYVFAADRLRAALDQLTNDNSQREYYITDVPRIMLRDGLRVLALPVLHPLESLSVNTVEHLQAVESVLRSQRQASGNQGRG
jgi:bifunctional UDP-N-acetylglucosamine pyrophosphorylase / glucosamine-1-phosphate N-acetyltransferase